MGRFTGTDPEGTFYDEPDFSVADGDPGAPASAFIGGTAADLDCWLWHRPPAARSISQATAVRYRVRDGDRTGHRLTSLRG